MLEIIRHLKSDIADNVNLCICTPSLFWSDRFGVTSLPIELRNAGSP